MYECKERSQNNNKVFESRRDAKNNKRIFRQELHKEQRYPMKANYICVMNADVRLVGNLFLPQKQF